MKCTDEAEPISRRRLLHQTVGAALAGWAGHSIWLAAAEGGKSMEKQVATHSIQPAGSFPNNPRLPLLVYPQAVQGGASAFEALFTQQGWGNNWRNGIFDIHHYHATAHEFIGVYEGAAKIQFGGPKGPVVSVKAGDAVVIPAGVAHKRVAAEGGFRVVGAYPAGQSPDMMYGRKGERPEADKTIARVALPKSDPLHGAEGPLLKHWKKDA